MERKGIIKISALFFVIIFMIVTLVFIAQQRKKIQLNAISIHYADTFRFITEAQVEDIIDKNFGILQGVLMDSIDTYAVKQKIEENEWVETASVFKGYARNDSLLISGALKVVIKHEMPLLRVLENGTGYYLNREGKKLPPSASYTLNVPVVSGAVNDSILQNQMLDFVSYVAEHDLLKPLIVQIHVLDNGELILIPRIGNHKIEFGKAVNVEKKFRNLLAVYENGFGNNEWEKYKTVSLKFNNQVICSIK